MQTLSAEKLTFTRGRQVVLREVSLTLRQGELLALVGPSGAGKTTLLWLMAGLLTPASGRVAISGPPARANGLPALAMAFQQPGLWEHLTVEQHLRLVLSAGRLPRAARRQRIESILSRLELMSLRKRRPAQLSGGQRQRLSLARALVVEPAWLLLDEPLSHLDGPARSALLQVLVDSLRDRGAGVLMATHHVAEALAVSDRVAVLHAGQLQQVGAPGAVAGFLAAAAAPDSVRHEGSIAAARKQSVPPIPIRPPDCIRPASADQQ